jgi:hypothetical protein
MGEAANLGPRRVASTARLPSSSPLLEGGVERPVLTPAPLALGVVAVSSGPTRSGQVSIVGGIVP